MNVINNGSHGREWLWEETRELKVVGSNPGTEY